MRAFEFDAVAGDWAIHCHKSHHTMNAMGHNVPNMIGVQQKDLVDKINRLVPDYMAMGEHGMAEMGAMEMPLPANTLPMMTGTGPFGPVGMGGMFSVVKVRDDLAPGDHRDPGPYRHPPGTVAQEYTGETPPAPRAPSAAGMAPSTEGGPSPLKVKKPGGHGTHH
jgi:hypothetical protein